VPKLSLQPSREGPHEQSHDVVQNQMAQRIEQFVLPQARHEVDEVDEARQQSKEDAGEGPIPEGDQEDRDVIEMLVEVVEFEPVERTEEVQQGNHKESRQTEPPPKQVSAGVPVSHTLPSFSRSRSNLCIGGSSANSSPIHPRYRKCRGRATARQG
jgi:hypothetical protein